MVHICGGECLSSELLRVEAQIVMTYQIAVCSQQSRCCRLRHSYQMVCPVRPSEADGSVLPISARRHCIKFSALEDPERYDIRTRHLDNNWRDEHTFRHSGESSRPHVTQTLCSVFCV